MIEAKKDRRKFTRLFPILFFISLSINIFLLALYIAERRSIPSYPIQESKGIQETKPSPEETKPSQEAKVTQEAKTPKGMVPLPFVDIKNKDYFLLCEKGNKTLYLYHSEEGVFSFVKSYPCIVGSNHVDKKAAGDLATPEGIYFLTSFLTGESLPEKYGSGAFALNYPNFLDRREGKKGSGIWLHGYSDRVERLPFSEGCVVVKDEVLKELKGFIKIGDTPLVIVDAIQHRPREDQQRLSQTFSHFLKGWETAWESRDPQKYLAFYSRDFVSSDGKGYAKFKEYKYRVNRSKRFIQVQIEQKSIILSQKDGGEIAIIRMDQDYRSDNFRSYSRKILYLKESQGNWEIIGEVTL
jgi:murein L,D-transpeptidase YafK